MEGDARFESVTGRYVYLTIEEVEYRLYFEEAGAGIPILMQHTAGANGSQWRHQLNDPELQQRFHLIAYDLPFHGKSLPPTGTPWWTAEYQLTRDFLMQVPLKLAAALNLDRPVFLGSSIGGHLAVDLARYHPHDFRAVIGCEAALWSGSDEGDAAFRFLNHPAIGNDYKGASMYGLTAPQAPEAFRRETAWTYSAGAPGIFAGDLHYWAVDHDLREEADAIDTRRTPVYLLTGEYDWATTPDDSQALADRIPGARFQAMKNLGHFPMSEDPETFATYLHPILEEIAAAS